MSEPLLATKLRAPPLRQDVISRPRLIDQLSLGLARKLTLISAPAGFGKTTLVAEWVCDLARTHPDAVIAWLSLDDADNEPDRFWRYVLAALSRSSAHLQLPTLHGLASSEPVLTGPADVQRNTARTEAMLVQVINELAGQGGRYVLVLDDLHLIHDMYVHRGLTFLVSHLPVNVHVVACSRSDPPWPLPRLRAKAELSELRARDLRFTPQEATAFLDQATGMELSPEDTEALERRTEGWIVGLQLAALSLQGRARSLGVSEISAYVRDFAGSNRFVLDYLVEEVLAQQTPEVESFLLQTSILDRLTGDLCDAVTGRTDGARILQDLDAANLFIIPLDDERQWYRYHQLFGELLRTRLRQSQLGSLADRHARASEWWEKHGWVAEAVGHAIDADDCERAARLVEGNALTMMDRGQLRPLVGWLDALPDSVMRARPWLCVYHALTQLYVGRELAVEPRLVDAERAMAEAGVEDPGVAGYIAAIRAYAATIQGEMQRAEQLAHRALLLLPEDRPMARGMAAEQLSVALYWAGDLSGAEAALKQALEVSRAAGQNHVALLALCHLAALRTERGQLRLASETFREALQLAESIPGPAYRSVPIAGFAKVRSTRVLREWNELQGALRLANEGIVECEQWGWADGLVFGYTDLSRVLQASGDVDGALEVLWKAKQAAEGSSFLTDNVAALEAELWLALGDQMVAAQWAEEQRLSPDDPIPFHREHTYQVYARLLLAQGRVPDAIKVLDRLQQLAARSGDRYAEIQVWVLQALAWASSALSQPTHQERAQQALARALELGEPEGFVRVFVDEGQAMATLLRSALAKAAGSAYLERLLAALEREKTAEAVAMLRVGDRERKQVHDEIVLIEPLSDREQEVLRMLATHLSTPEMAESLIVSTHTVRSHIKSIYGKLGVHSRLEAVDRARELGLL